VIAGVVALVSVLVGVWVGLGVAVVLVGVGVGVVVVPSGSYSRDIIFTRLSLYSPGISHLSAILKLLLTQYLPCSSQLRVPFS
jgi:hypothetical protein